MRIGVLYPMHSAEDDYPRLAAMLQPGVDAIVEHTRSSDVHSFEECRRAGDWERPETGRRSAAAPARRRLHLGMYERQFRLRFGRGG